MGAKTAINWTDATWNPVTGCTPAGVGCAHCYAKRVAERFPAVHGGLEAGMMPEGFSGMRAIPFSRVICHPERLTIPEHWRKPRAIMCPSMGDLFHEDVPCRFRFDVFQVMALCAQHTFIVLTKRPERMCKEMQGMMLGLQPPTNVVLGVSCSTQAEADRAIPILLDTPANRRIVSLEPLVGPVGLRNLPARDCSVPHPLPLGWEHPERFCSLTGQRREEGEVNMHGLFATLDGVIVGGETGPGARPMHPDWVRLLRNQCEAAGVPFFFKQWGTGLKKESYPVRFFASTAGWDARVPKGGRLLDSRTHDELCWDVAGKGEAK